MRSQDARTSRIVANRPGSKLNNLCFSGATTADVLADQLGRALRADPNLVTVGVGINDVGRGISLTQFARNYDEILSRLGSTNATIVVANIPDISSAPRIPLSTRNEYHQVIVEFNQKLAEIVSRHRAVMFDIYAITHEQLPIHPEHFSPDGFHPSDKGYELWAEQMWPTIAEVIGVESK